MFCTKWSYVYSESRCGPPHTHRHMKQLKITIPCPTSAFVAPKRSHSLDFSPVRKIPTNGVARVVKKGAYTLKVKVKGVKGNVPKEVILQLHDIVDTIPVENSPTSPFCGTEADASQHFAPLCI